MHNESTPVIETTSLTRRYGKRRGIESLTFSVPQGALFGFLGPNGAGKTTAIRVFIGLLRPSGGVARILGLECWRRSLAVKAEVGYLPGDLRLYPWMTGKEALQTVGRVRRQNVMGPGRDLAQRYELDLTVKVRNMSRGMRQKLGLILAMAHQPRLLILDEPTTGLDPLVQLTVHQQLREIVKSGRSVFLSSHTLSEVDQLCDRVAVIREGRLVVEDSLMNLRRLAGREVTIRWRNSSDSDRITPPPFLKLQRRDATCWTAALNGPVDELVTWLAGHSIEDLTIGRPDLESLFRQYYESSVA